MKNKKKLNLGSGDFPFKDYINIDIYEERKGVDLIADVRDLSMFDDDSIDEVFAKDLLEHIKRTEWRKTIDEWVRVIRPGGLLKIRFPDIFKLFKIYNLKGFKPPHHKNRDLSEKELETIRFETFNRYVFGLQDFTANNHMTALTDWIVRDYLESIGMIFVDQWYDGGRDCRLTMSKGDRDESLSLHHPDYLER